MSKSRHTIAHMLHFPEVGGTEQATLRIAQAVEGDGFSSVVFCLTGKTPVIDLFAKNGVETATWDKVELGLKRPQPFLRASFALAREFRRRKIDVVHCADWEAATYAGVAAKMARLPVISHVRNRDEDISPRNRKLLRAVDKFAFVSRETWQRFGYPVSERRGLVLYDGLEIDDGNGSHVSRETEQEVRREFGIPAGAKIVGMVARLARQKDFATLAKAAQLVVAAHPNMRFLIVGQTTGNDYYAEVKRLLADAGVEPYFVFTDYREDVPRLVSAMNVFVLSTHFEGLPLVIIEALAQGKPVVATAVDGIPEIVIHGQTGLLHRHEDDAQLAEGILALLGDEERAAQLGAAGREFIKTNFSKGQFAANVKKLYRDVLDIE